MNGLDGKLGHARRGLLIPCVLMVLVAAGVAAAQDGGGSHLRAFPEALEGVVLRRLALAPDRAPLPALAAHPAPPGAGALAVANLGDVPSAEIVLDRSLPGQGAFDRAATLLGRPGGPLCIVELEDLALRSLRSTNGGVTFGSEVTVAGGAGAGAVLDFAAGLAADGTVYAAFIAADPAGDRGLRFARSQDGCQSWSAPRGLVAGGSTALGVTAVALATGDSGRVSIVFAGRNGYAAYGLSSSDAGETWNGPVRLDPGSGASSYPVTALDVALDPSSGRVFAVYAQDRGTGSSIWQTRSTDGGATFAAEQNLDAITANRLGSDLPNVEVVAGGVVLIAYWDDFSNNSVYVARSADGGQSYAAAWDEPAGSSVPKSPLALAYDPAAAAIQLAFAYNDSLWHTRSTDNGATFAALTVLNSTADADPWGARPIPSVAQTRTASGTWVLAWSDTRSDSYANTRSDVYVRRSIDEGATWLADLRADSDPGGAAGSTLVGLAATAGDEFFAAWIERRNGTGRDEDLYGNRYVSGFGSDFRLDGDALQASAAALGDPVVATDGASGVYVAFTARATGHEYDIWVARSTDGGYAFSDAVRVGGAAPGERVVGVPYLAATPDGNVYLVFYSDNPSTGERELRFNRSSDFGASWRPADTVLDSFAHPAGYFVAQYDYPNVQLAGLNGGVVYVAWSDNVNVFLARSFDGGATFDIRDVDQDGRGYNRHPALCAQGNQIVLAIMAPQVSFSYLSVWGTVSSNRGDTWTDLVQLRPESTSERAVLPVVACDGSNRAVVAWMDLRNGTSYALRANRWTGSKWGGDEAIAGPAAVPHFFPRIAYATASRPIIVFQDLAGSVYAARSTDSGSSFPNYVRLDDVAPDPAQVSDAPRIASDGNDAWIFWTEWSAGEASIVARVTRDGGTSYDAIRRIDREDPQGAFLNGYYIVNAAPAAAADAAFLAWGGQRADGRRDILVNAVDLDDKDRDSVSAAADCNDADPGVWAAPAEVAGLGVTRAGATTRVSWTSQDGIKGPATRYDVVSGLLSELRSAAGFTGATCHANDLADTPYDDAGGAPPLANGRYYLARAANACGTGTYGDSGQAPDPRDPLDGGAPCP